MWSNSMAKGIVSIVMWVIVGFISFAAISDVFGTMNETGGNLVALVLGPLGIGFVTTFFIWVLPELIEADHKKAALESKQDEEKEEKAKRTGAMSIDKIALLMEMMDEDELADFKQTLKREVLTDMGYGGGDSLASLLDDENPRKHLRG